MVCHFSMSISYLRSMRYVILVCQYFIYVPCGMSLLYVNILSTYHVVCHFSMSIFFLGAKWYVISVCQYFFLHACGMSFQCVNILFTYQWYVISVCLYFVYIPRSMSFPYHCCSADVGVFCSRGSSGPSSLLALTQQSSNN